MIYSFEKTVSLGTAETSKEVTELPLCKGIIHQVEIQFPVGCGGLTHVQLRDNLSQIWPSNPSEYFTADGFVISFREDFELKFAPYRLWLYTWNTSALYDHTITVRLGILPKQAFMHRLLPDVISLFYNFRGEE